MSAALDDVSDTALWVATYRARETERPDALFRDPLARKLAGDRGARIERRMSDSRYVAWSVVLRTRIIDDYVTQLLGEGVDTVLNLGAGLDTRPYRLELPAELRWIEVDFPKIVTLKEAALAEDVPRCRLSRRAMDLSREDERGRLFAELDASAKKVLVLTEGVTPYLDERAVGSLADDIARHERFVWWITDYNSPELMKRMMRPKRQREMTNAPFRFNPPDWHAFFATHGWRARSLRYIGEAAVELRRPVPHPWWVRTMLLAAPRSARDRFKRMNGYAVLEKNPPS